MFVFPDIRSPTAACRKDSFAHASAATTLIHIGLQDKVALFMHLYNFVLKRFDFTLSSLEDLHAKLECFQLSRPDQISQMLLRIFPMRGIIAGVIVFLLKGGSHTKIVIRRGQFPVRPCE